MSDTTTPRTDAAEHGPGRGGLGGHCDASFARELESELTTAKARIAETEEKEIPWIDSNETVEVKLNDHGKKHWRETYARYPTLQAMADSETFKTPLWTLLEVFGPVTYIGGVNHLAIRPLPPPPQGKDQK